jgi:hypothetical protein
MDWNTIAKSTLECRTCDRFYETPFEWLGKKEREMFIDHLYNSHVLAGRRRGTGRPKSSRKKIRRRSARS